MASYQLILADCFEWLQTQPENSIHAIVTDPPYGIVEFTQEQLLKKKAGRGGVWRIPPTIGGSVRAPLPRFTILNAPERKALSDFFSRWANLVYPKIVPGGHIFLASNPLLSTFAFHPIIQAGFEKRGEIIRLVRTFRGGDRPKNAETEFDDVSAMPRSAWEPWGLFRKPLEGRLADNLRKWGTGGLRRVSAEQPFCDVIESVRTPRAEKEICPHPSLKPQQFMRQIVRASLPLGKGVVVDTFSGGGSTVAAATAVGYDSIGIEINSEYHTMAKTAVPRLSNLENVFAVNDYPSQTAMFSITEFT